ncbi:MAG: aminotransferase class I/II-fold pyridoxal phosphate-dependent enzyme [Phycisphaerae bacterium]|nr:aminotransferase class I/II-fold pyridoxal phosphate-dependent enzyme [Phycisphaerae bacterium]
MPNSDVIDFRSDTVTKPTPEMRRAMAEAEVGDDIFGEDPTVNRLEEKVCEMLGKEAAVYVTSGSQANQVAIRSQTQPGDELIGSEASHFYRYETGAAAVLSGCSVSFVRDDRGVFTGEDVLACIRPPDQHYPISRMVICENTQNRGCGKVWPVEAMASIRRVADEKGLIMHMDGARLWNACVASGLRPTDYTRYFETVSVCFSKGLGAPIGSAVAGPKAVIARARRARKMLGGAMRQAGIIAAGALYALEHNIDRLAEDHANARRLAEALAELPGIQLDPAIVETNILLFDVDPSLGTAQDVVDKMDAVGVKMLAVAPQRVRGLTHLNVSSAQTDEAIVRVRGLFGKG